MLSYYLPFPVYLAKQTVELEQIYNELGSLVDAKSSSVVQSVSFEY